MMDMFKPIRTGHIEFLCARGGTSEMHLTISDERSGLVVLQACMSMADFAEMITGKGGIRVPYFVNQSPLIGQDYEIKSVEVPIAREDAFPGRDPENHERFRLALLNGLVSGGHLMGGWTPPDRETTWNGHRYNNGKYKLHLERWLPAQEEEKVHA